VTTRRRVAVAAAPVTGPTWLDPESVKTWLRLTDPGEDALVGMCCAAVEPFVQQCRPDQYVVVVVPEPDPPVPPVFTPDAEVYQAAVMLAARVYRRRNSSGGLESVGDQVAYVARYDPEIERALRTATWRVPGVG
jgi:hypothetical protein